MLSEALQVRFMSTHPANIKRINAFAGWGRKKSYHKARILASKYQKPIISLEDGFLRSIHSGIHSRYAISYIADDLGIYFDLNHPSRLEQLILNNIYNWHHQKQQRAQVLMDKIIRHKLSKYNQSLVAPNLSAIAGNDKAHVIIIDQVQKDSSVMGAGADEKSFIAMLRHAKQNHSDCNIWLKAHPAGKGYFHSQEDVFYLAQPCNPIALLSQANIVYTVSSHMGFEALMLGKIVYCFGVAWYAGFGLTKDCHAPSALLKHVQQRRQITHASIHQLFYSAYVDYSHYADPASFGINQSACDIDTALNWLITNRNHALKYQGTLLAYGLSAWKNGFVRAFVQTPLNHLTIQSQKKYRKIIPNWIQHNLPICKLDQNHSYDFIIVWGLAWRKRLKTTVQQNTSVLCMEDGFIRSQGLGASLLAPLSIVLDTQGIYYNARQPSDLERLLTSIHLTDEQRQQIDCLLNKLMRERISKYNVGKSCDLFNQIQSFKQKNPQAMIRLVVGQVEDDASVHNCLSSITSNAKLLADVRKRHPNDIIIYKPHPDVEAGLRLGQIHNDMLALADLVVHDAKITDCLDCCDVLHTISSLAGFEAIIRGKQVSCYGLPFYAGFGLSDDIPNQDNLEYQTAIGRRWRNQALDTATLAYATLIAYPLYRLPNGIGLAQAHQVVDYLAKTQQTPPKSVHLLKKRLGQKLMQWRLRTKHKN